MATKKPIQNRTREYRVFSYRLKTKTAEELKNLRDKSGYSWNRFIKLLLDTYAKDN